MPVSAMQIMPLPGIGRSQSVTTPQSPSRTISAPSTYVCSRSFEMGSAESSVSFSPPQLSYCLEGMTKRQCAQQDLCNWSCFLIFRHLLGTDENLYWNVKASALFECTHDEVAWNSRPLAKLLCTNSSIAFNSEDDVKHVVTFKGHIQIIQLMRRGKPQRGYYFRLQLLLSLSTAFRVKQDHQQLDRSQEDCWSEIMMLPSPSTELSIRMTCMNW